MDIFSIIAAAIMVVAVAIGFMKRFSYANMLVVANILVFFLILFSPFVGFSSLHSVQVDLGFRASYLSNGNDLYTLFTSMFVHLNLVHLLGNMMFLYLVGNALEERVGKRKFVAVFFISGIAGTLIEAFILNGSSSLMMGASGAISGVMGALLLLYPRDKIPMFFLIIFLPSVAVWISVGSWFAWQVLMVSTTVGGVAGGTVAYGAHIGGFLIGMLVAHLYPVSEAKAPREVDVTTLEPLANTKELKNAMENIRGETNPDVRNAWLDYFAKNAKCPQCGGALELKGNKLKSGCGFELRLK